MWHTEDQPYTLAVRIVGLGIWIHTTTQRRPPPPEKEGVTWIHGHHADGSPEARALLVARALHDGGSGE